MSICLSLFKLMDPLDIETPRCLAFNEFTNVHLPTRIKKKLQ